jgi:hypothetical protein
VVSTSFLLPRAEANAGPCDEHAGIVLGMLRGFGYNVSVDVGDGAFIELEHVSMSARR